MVSTDKIFLKFKNLKIQIHISNKMSNRYMNEKIQLFTRKLLGPLQRFDFFSQCKILKEVSVLKWTEIWLMKIEMKKIQNRIFNLFQLRA